jgi:predicted extracellular nuclease
MFFGPLIRGKVNRMMLRSCLLVLFCLYSLAASIPAADLHIATYNIENLFDAVDDPAKEDFDATRWDAEKLDVKCKNLAAVIQAMNGGRGPDILGLAEVENRAVVEQMLAKIKLPQREYKVVHHDSPDERGIDVAIVYDAKLLKLADEKAHPVTVQTTRDILEAKLSWDNDVLYVMMNHWPSQNNPETDRIAAAKVLRTRLDEILKHDPRADIVCLGDFNEKLPTDPAILDALRSTLDVTAAKDGVLLNTGGKLLTEKNRGTYVYQNEWGALDHILVSPGLVHGPGVVWKKDSTRELREPKLLTKGNENQIPKPHATYSGKNFDPTGISDHLPLECYLTK